MRGRKPKPTALRLIDGSKARRRPPKAEPKPKRCIPSPPDHVSPAARVAWGALASKLDRLGLLTELDAVALEQACELYAEVVALRAELADTRSQVVATKTGAAFERQRPQVAMLQRAVAELRLWLGEFGMTPAARSRVSAEPPVDDDPAERFFR